MPKLSEMLGVNRATVHPSSRVAQALARQGVSKSPELMRVLALPRRKFDVANYPDASILYSRGPCGVKGCLYCDGDKMPSLRPIQNAMLVEAAQNSGGFFQIGVGQGKTLPSLLMHDALNARRTVLLVPPSLRTKTLNVDVPILGKHFTLPPIYPAEHVLESLDPGVYVVAYSELSATDASDLLDKIDPDLVVADEAHCLARKESARTRRFLRFARKRTPKFVPMSGTMAKDSLTDFAHLIELALGAGSPLPVDYPSLVEWADAIDHEGEAGHTGIGALSLFCEDGETARDGFRRRLQDTPGVISTVTTSCDASIEIRLCRPTPPFDVLQALDNLSSSWAWDGDEYDKVIDIARLERALTQGFFYRLKWPNGVKDHEWLDARNAWGRAIRARLAHQNRAGQDSAALLEGMAERGEWVCPEWIQWSNVRDRAKPDREPIEISRWLVGIAEKWAAQGPGLIWIDAPIVGEWLAEAGIPYYGEGSSEELAALSQSPQAGQMTIAISHRVGGTGQNLQKWTRNLVTYPPANGVSWEQLIGRTHREGQKADKITVDVLLPTDGANRAFENAKADAIFSERTMGQPQKLNVADIVDLDFTKEIR